MIKLAVWLERNGWFFGIPILQINCFRLYILTRKHWLKYEMYSKSQTKSSGLSIFWYQWCMRKTLFDCRQVESISAAVETVLVPIWHGSVQLLGQCWRHGLLDFIEYLCFFLYTDQHRIHWVLIFSKPVRTFLHFNLLAISSFAYVFRTEGSAYKHSAGNICLQT